MKNPENASEEYECEYERIIKNIWKKKSAFMNWKEKP